MSKPTIIFVPGGWHKPSSFNQVSDLLSARGYPSTAISLASVGGDPNARIQSFEPDVQLVREAVSAVLDKGEDVVLVMHSYGGAPGSETMRYFMDDAGSGKGRVIMMVWITAFVFQKGGTLLKMLGGKNLPWFEVSGDTVTPATPEEIFYNDLPASTASTWVDKLEAHSYRTFFSELTVEPWRTIPSVYMVCELDNAIPAQAQEGMIAMAQRENKDAFKLVERVKASHSPFLSMPEKVTEFLIKAAGGL